MTFVFLVLRLCFLFFFGSMRWNRKLHRQFLSVPIIFLNGFLQAYNIGSNKILTVANGSVLL